MESQIIVNQIKAELEQYSVPTRALKKARFFKTGKGEYGEGDTFIGVNVPEQRKIARSYFRDADLPDIEVLLASPVHEHRLTALFIFVEKYKRLKTLDKKKAYAEFYLDHTAGINNWDLVDSSAHYTLGDNLCLTGDYSVLRRLAQSENLWEQRIAMLSTFAFIRADQYSPAFEIADMLLDHTHDLIHKAVGWMLREAGNRDMAAEVEYLKNRYKTMPRTMLRYAVEKFPEERRQMYLRGKI